MNTESQKVVEIYHAPAAASDSEATASTSKTQVFVKRFDSLNLGLFYEMIAWCRDNLYHGGHYEPDWWTEYPTFYFRNEKEYMFFCLKWS